MTCADTGKPEDGLIRGTPSPWHPSVAPIRGTHPPWHPAGAASRGEVINTAFQEGCVKICIATLLKTKGCHRKCRGDFSGVLHSG